MAKKNRTQKTPKKAPKRNNIIVLVIGGALIAVVAVLITTTLISQSKLQLRDVTEYKEMNSVNVSE